MKLVPLATCTVSLCLVLAPLPATARTPSKSAAADSLYRRACARTLDHSLDLRRAALDDFEEAVRLDPDRADIWLAFGQACLDLGQFSRGRTNLKHAVELTPDDADALCALGVAWRHDWLNTLEKESLDECAKCFERAGEVAPARADAWAAASAIELLRGHNRDALVDAQRARRADYAAPEPLLAIGAALYRMGKLAYADSAFRAARDRLPPELARRFDQMPYALDRSAASADAGGARPQYQLVDTSNAPLDDPWAPLDPDLTTPENEAQLDYWTRLALVMFVFRDGDRVRWDMRAELMLRYGVPAGIAFNPAGWQLGEREFLYHYQRFVPNAWAPPPIGYAYNLQLWYYPELGMAVELWDRQLTQDYVLPPNDNYDPDPRPNPGAVAARPDLMVLANGRGVVRAMAPGAQPMTVTAALTRYPLADATRLLAHVVAKGERSDSLWGAWAVMAEDGHVVARSSGPMLISACDPTTRQVGEFASALPPGAYRVDVSVRGPSGAYGIAHEVTRIEPPVARLEMSDLVLPCGNEATSIGPEGVRVEPDMDRLATGGTLIAYYELEHLTPAANGISRFEYRYTIWPKAGDEAKAKPVTPALENTREEQYVGTHRRQFVNVPIASLPRGDYELRVEVHDLVSDDRVAESIEFTRAR